eukprot:TRINITY_DN75056_c0_g1_i1.p1 TRINITY_DN75056_c0_g1~~TRINITY_DN75056_c0_g1_i1.p1  ORF type:complete len:435 (-),score=41.49 TRINITY_DN75056_c0_g1_i1:69-1280(-)
MEAARQYTASIAALFRFYSRYVGSFDEIHPEIMTGEMLPPRQRHLGTLRFDGAFALRFEHDLEAVKEVTRRCSPFTLSFATILGACHVLRVLTCAMAVFAPEYALFVGALQFVVAPLSFPIAVFKLMTYLPEGVVHHVLLLLLGPLIGGVGPNFVMDFRLLAWLIAADQLLNLAVYLAWSEPFGPLRLLRHALYGTFDTKLYYVIVFGCLHGLKIDAVLLVVVGIATLASGRYLVPWLKAKLRVPCSHVLFYMDHRIAHLPVVYQHAHKMHHHLHDTTPWAAHVYGEGMNEHFFLLLLDVLPCLLAPSYARIPYFFSVHLLYISWINKPHHTRLKPGTPYESYANYHSNHHTLHTKNLALNRGALLDFYFGTQGPKATTTEDLIMLRRIEGDQIVIEVSPRVV